MNDDDLRAFARRVLNTPRKPQRIALRPLDEQYRNLLWGLFHIDLDDVTAVTIDDSRVITFEMGRGDNATVSYEVRPCGKSGPRQ